MKPTINQHYVPRFYMKNFSNVKNIGTKKEKSLISFYQFKNNLLKENIPINSICAEDYFYDEDGRIENTLSNLEGKWSKSLKNAINENITMNDIENIREFAVYQFARTKAMLYHNREITESIMRKVLNQNISHISDKESFNTLLKDKVENEITPESILANMKKLIFVMSDLKMKIINNKTEKKFITSDVPIIMTNPFHVHISGLASIGEVLFFPISPFKMIFFYDGKLFDEIPDNIESEVIIEIFNNYQYISADERILAMNLKDINYIINDNELNSKREKFHKIKKIDAIDDGHGIFIAAKSRSIPYYYTIPFLHLPVQLKKIPVAFRETFDRKYSYDTRLAILCRIYGTPDFANNSELMEHWKKQKNYSKKLLKYLDSYWNTPKEDTIITPNLMNELKKVRIDCHINKDKY